MRKIYLPASTATLKVKIFAAVKTCKKNHRLILAFLFFLALLAGQKSSAQTANQYTFSTVGTGSLALDRNSNVVDMSTGTTTLVGANTDEGVSGVTNIGFTFTFFSAGAPNYTQFTATSNGALRLGGTAMPANVFAAGFNSANRAIIAPYLGDLRTSTTGKVHYKLVGAYPNRVLVVEFLNMGINYSSTLVDGTFQVRLYEQSNIIEYVYGAMKVGGTTTPASRVVAIGFANNTGINNEFSVNQSTYATTTAATATTNTNAATGNIAGLNSAANGSRRVFTFIPTLAYKSQFTAMSTGAATWCAGETRDITVTIKNIGTTTWVSGGAGLNLSYWWSNQTQDFNPRQQPFVSLAAGQSQTVTIPVTATVAGTYTLNFDLVREGVCWFRDNTAGCAGPGNILYTSSNITINATPAVPTGTATQTFCAINNPTVSNLAATGTTIKWYAAASGGTALLNTDALVSGSHYYASETNASGCESLTRLDVTATIGNPPAPTGTAAQSFCAINNPTVANLAATGTAIKWYSVSSGGTALASTAALVNGSTYYATQTISGCESATRFATAVTVGDPAAPTGTSSQSFCTINNPTITNLVASGSAIQWYTVATGGTPLLNTASLTSGNYFAAQTVGGCESATRLAVNVIVGNPAAPTGAASQSFCTINSPTISNLAATGTAVEWYTTSTGGTALVNTTPLVDGTTYYASQTISGCQSATRLAVTVAVGDPAAPVGSSAQLFCAINNPTIANIVVTGTTVKWYLAPTGGTALLTTDALISGTHYYASQTLSGCESAIRLDVEVTIDNPVAPTGSASQSFCAINSPAIADLVATGTAIKWYTVSSGGTALLSTAPLVNGTHYYASQTIGGCESALRLDVTAIVGNPSAPTGAAAQTFCADINPTIADLIVSGTSIQWYSTATGGTPLATTTSLASGVHYYASQTLTGCESATRLDITATVYQPVVITTQPNPGPQIICSSFPATFSIAATGDIVSYQWYLGSTPLTNNSNINGAQTNTLLIDQVSPADQGFYHVVVTGNGPCGDVISADAELQVNQNIVISSQPAPQVLCVGNIAVFSVSTSTGTGLTYQWRKGTIPLSDGGSISGATTDVLTITGITAADAGTYNVIISDGSAGCPNTNSTNALLTVNATSIGGTVGGSTAVCSGTNSGTLTLTGRTGNILNWEFSTDGGTTWTLISNTTTSQAYTNLTQTTLYRAVVKSGVCPPDNSIAATITVNQLPDAIATPAAQAICSGDAITTINLTSSLAGTTYTWTRNNTATVTGIAATGSGDINGTLTNTTALPVTVTFTITPTASGCAGTSTTATILVKPTPIALAAPASQTRCSGVAITNIILTSTTPGTSFAWTRDNTASVTGISANGSGDISGTLINTTTAPVTVTFTITPTANGCDGIPLIATVLVNPTPDAIATPASQTVCSANAITAIVLTGNTTGTTYTWTRDNTIAATGIGASGSGNITGTLTNTTAAPVTVTFTITPSANGCAGAPITATVLVNPTPVTTRTPASQTICSGDAITIIGLTSTTTGTTFTWIRDNTATVTGIAASGSGDISGSLTNTTFAPTTVTFTITPSANGCPGVATTATVLVNPTPNAIATPASQTRCSGIAIANIALTSSTAGTTYAWTRDNSATVTGIAASGAGSISGTLTNTTFAPVTVTFTITPSANGCTGTPITATVLVNPTANAVATPASQTICSGNTITSIQLTSSTTGTTFTWTRNNTATITGIAASGSGDISGSLLNTTANPVIVTFTITPTANGCVGTTTTATVLVNPTPNAVATPASQTRCSGVAIGNIVLTSSTASTTFTWTRDNNASVTGIAASGSGNIAGTLTNTTLAPITVTFTITPSANGCIGNPITATVLVNPIPDVVATPSSQTICSATPITNIVLSTNATGVTTTYAWTRNNTASVTGIAASGSGNIAGTLTNTTAAPVTVTFTITPTANGCAGTPITAMVLVNPTPVTTRTPASQTICSGGTITAIALSSTTTGTTFTWTRNNTATVTGIAASGSGDINGSLTNTTFAPITVTFIITPSANGCTGGTTTATVLVNPTPNAIATPASQTKCSGVAITTIALTTSATGVTTTYAWTRDNTALVTGIGASGSGNISGTLTNTTAAPITVTFTITPTANGCAGAPITATVLVNPKPTAAAISGASTVCIGATINLTPAGSGIGALNYTWASTNNAVATVNSSGAVTGVGTGTTQITYTVTDVNGCTSTSSANFPLTVTKPVANAITAATNIVCINSTIALSANATGTATLTYTWASSNTAVATVSNTGVVTGISAGGVNITYTVTDGNGCQTTSAPYPVTVNPIPTGTFAAAEASGTAPNDNVICAGATVTFTAPASFGSYIFKVNGTTVQTGTSNTYFSSTLSNGASVTVDIANSVNCGATFGPINISVTPLPIPTLIADKAAICPGENVTFTAGGGTSYNFKLNGSSVQSGASATYSTTALTPGNSVTVDVTNATACTATSSAVGIVVNPLPVGTFTATTSTICAGQNITFTATAGFANYDFKVNNVSVQNSSSNTFSSATLTNGQVVTVDVTSGSGCVATFGPPQIITVNALPVGTLNAAENSNIPNDGTICSGSPVTFTATPGFSNYAFSINAGAFVQNGASNTYSNSSLANGDVITVMVTSSSNCSSTFNAVTITVVPSPAGTLAASTSSICAGDDIDFTATAGFANYNFKKNGISFQNGASNTASHSGFSSGDIVTVDVSNAATCTATFNQLVITVNPLPTGSLSVAETSGTSNNDGIICTGANVSFTATAGYSNYNFKVNGTTVQFNAVNTFSSNTLANGDIISVEVTNATNCVATFNLINITVNTIPPVANITGTLSAICVNSSTTFSSATAGGVWTSSNVSVASVNASGLVSGIAAGTATISYKVTTAFGCDSTVTKSITVHALPVVAAITGASAVCVSSSIQLNDATAGGVWSTSDASIATVDAAGLVTGVSAGTVTINYTVTNINTCTTVVSKTITVNALPVVAAITGTTGVCKSSTTQLSNIATGGTWSSSNTLVATINASGLVSGVAPGTATISYSVTNGTGCNTTVTTVVTVFALPVPTLTGSNPICPGSLEIYTTEPGQSNYVWTFTGGTLVSGGGTNDNTIEIFWDQPGPKTIYVNYQNANGCSGATSSTVATSTATTPVITGPAALCMNVNGTFTTQSGFTDYTWTASGGATVIVGTSPNDNTATVNWTTAGTQTVSVNFSDLNGCTSPAPTIYTVTVRTLPTATITGTTSVCENAPAPSITFTGATGTAPYTFTYTINGGPDQTISTTAGNSVSLPVSTSATGSFDYELISVSDNNTCSQLQSGTASITVNPLPTAIINGNTTICQNDASPVVTFTGAGGTAPYIFTYNINGGANQTVSSVGNTASVNVPTGTAGTFVYNLVSVRDGSTTACLQSQAGSETITVNPVPTATVSGTTSVCINSTSPVITFTGAGGTSPYTFTYNINGGGNLTVVSVGNIATVPASTAVAGAYVYNLVSIVDASSTLCSQAQAGSVTVTVDLASVGGAVSANSIVCSGTNSGTLILTGHTGNIVRWESSTDGGTTWTTIVNTTTSFTYTNILITTQYRAVLQSGTCSSANSAAAIISVNAISVGGSVSNNAIVCSGTNSGTLTLSGQTGTVVRWESSVNGGTTWSSIANTTTIQNYSNITQTTRYRAVVSNGVCAAANSAAAIITVNPLPTATISGTVSVCQNATSPNITFTGANGTAPYTFTYRINAGGNLTVVSVGNIATVPAPTNTTGVFTYTLLSVSDASSTTCSQNQGGTAIITVNAPPPAFILTPGSATLCQGAIQSLTASSNISSTGTFTLGSGNVNLAIPDLGSISRPITVSGIPAGAIINSVIVNFNINHSAAGDLVLNLRAPNNSVLNLVNNRGGTGNNFTNTTISSASINPVSAGGAPFPNTYSADGQLGVGAPNPSTVANFAGLTSVPNGNWVFEAEDDVLYRGFFQTNTGTFTNWSITINYTVPTTPLNVTWAPVTDLYTDAAATISYTGQSLSTVYAKPASPGTKTYTATATNAANCNTSQNVVLTVNSIPTVIISADYCAVAGKVQLTANSTPAATSYAWSTGQTTQTILVDIADDYTVAAFLGTGCPGTATINVANELVINGDFESGDGVGFTTNYISHTGSFYTGGATTGLWPEGYYAVDTSAFSPSNGTGYHPSFHGKDHTTGHGQFMMVNGSVALKTIWEETVPVLPNTTYYFSAWGMNLNPGSPAQLQFSVNGAQTGTIGNLNTAPMPTTEAQVGVGNWIRFYGTWTSGPTTTSAVINIVNLNTLGGGNDFGIDDVSFATLSTFIDLISAPGTDAQTICVNTPLTEIVYSVGNGNVSGPNVTGLPAGVTSVFANGELKINGTPAIPGNYTYTITTTGCAPYSVTGTINTQQQTITLTSGSASPTICINSPMTNIVYTVGGTGTGATITGLPAGLTGVYNAGTKTLTISGTPTVAGVFRDTIITTGTCKADTAVGTITVQQQTITLSSGSATQAVCINSGIGGIIYTVGGTGTGAGITGLPAGLTGFYSGGSFIISGTPTVSGTFNYTITTTGTCAPGATASGTITVNPAAAIVLGSGAGSDNQVVCINSSLINIVYNISGGGTNASVTAGSLPAGVTGSFSGGSFTISGTPTVAGIFNYTITTTGTCAQSTITGKITVETQTVLLTSGSASPTLCMGSTLTDIVFTVSGTATGASLTAGAFPPGITGIYDGATNRFIISGSPTATGVYSYTITTSGNCATNSASGVINVTNGTIGGTLPSAIVSICTGGSGIFNLTGNIGNITRWEQSIDGGTTWTNIANTTTTLSYTNVNIPTLYRALVKSGSCSAAYSTIASVGIHNMWSGATSSDWFTASNWSDGLVPSMSCPSVIIPAVTAPNVYPVLNSGTALVNNLIINSTASLTITGATMRIAGTITNAGTFDVTDGTLDFNGTSPQVIAGNMFTGNTLKNLALSNVAGLTVGSPGVPLNVSGVVSFGNVSGATIHTGGNIVLLSNAAGTARIADITNNGTNTGNRFDGTVTVERYFPARRAWRLFTAPVSAGGNVFDNWQNSGVYQPGRGTYVSGALATNPTGANGLDWSPLNNSSLKTGIALSPILNTHTAGLSKNLADTSDNIPYFIFVRGDRLLSNTNPALSNNTTLSSRGKLQTGRQTFPATPLDSSFTMIGNPYASPVDMSKILRNNVVNRFYVWDPYINVDQGAYVVFDDFDNDGTYIATPPSGLTQVLQSGQAFYVQTASNGPASIVFNETAKSSANNTLAFRPPVKKGQTLRINMHQLNADNNTVLVDGTLAQFDNTFAAGLDDQDAVKVTNIKEMLSLKRNGKLLAIESRPAPQTGDTLFLQLSRTTQRNYRFEFSPANLDASLTAVLEDSYTGTKKPLSVTTNSVHDFAITSDALSASGTRFKIVFRQIAPVPVTTKTIRAYPKALNAVVEWSVDNEINISKYEVEKSVDGINYVSVHTTASVGPDRGVVNYAWVDLNTVNGNNYYRIRSVGPDNKYDHTKAVLVKVERGAGGIRVFPNPVTTGVIGLEFKNMAAGIYKTRLLNELGQTIFTKRVNHTAGTSMENITPDYRLLAGVYQLEIISPDGSTNSVKVIVK